MRKSGAPRQGRRGRADVGETRAGRATPGRAGGRSSPHAIEKRRAARAFNEALLGPASRAGAIDGRTERRRRRLLKELAERERAGGKTLKPVDVLARVSALLELGEPLRSIRKAYPPPRAREPSEAVLSGLRRIHRAYGFVPDAYRFVGIDEASLRQAGVVGRRAPRASPKSPGIASTKPRPEPARTGREPRRQAGSSARRRAA